MNFTLTTTTIMIMGSIMTMPRSSCGI